MKPPLGNHTQAMTDTRLLDNTEVFLYEVCWCGFMGIDEHSQRQDVVALEKCHILLLVLAEGVAQLPKP